VLITDYIHLIRESFKSKLKTDDTQIYSFCSPGTTIELQSRWSACIDDVSQWMKSNRLQLNAVKTEVIWCSSTRRQHQIPTAPLMVGSDAVHPVQSVRNLGMYMNLDLTMRTQISRTVSCPDGTNTQHQTVCDKTSTSVTSGVLSLDAVGCRQCDTGRPTTYTTGQMAVRAQCCGTYGVAYSSRKYMIISQTYFASYIGYECGSALTSDWQLWFTAVYMVRVLCN